ncbi:MAG: hypothetical protein RL120_16910 [Gammaproteobacteria bacterium]
MAGSCGFQLRDSLPAADLERIYVVDQVDIRQMIDEPLGTRLANDLGQFAAQVLTAPAANTPGIVITDERVTERSLSLSTNLLNRQVEVEKLVNYQIIDSSGEILLSSSLSASEILTESQSSPGAGDQEKRMLLRSINADLSRRLIYKLDSMLRESADE